MIKGLTYKRYRVFGSFMLTLTTASLLPTGFSKSCSHKSDSMTITNELSSLKSANAWINSSPLTAEKLKRKVVLIEFCTYTCINWLRTLPYVRAWSEKYKDKGLVVIGVHTPEFPFEKDLKNVNRSVKDMHIGFPIALDNDYAIWNGFSNQYWPAIYLLDTMGQIRYHQFGEGEYEQSEKMIQQLLTEAGVKDVSRDLVSNNATGAEAVADWNNLGSQENYLGYERTENFSSRNAAVPGKSHSYLLPVKLKLNQWALGGDWNMGAGSVSSSKTNGKIAYQFHARDLHLVMGPASLGTSVRFRVLIDGKPPGSSHGTDIDEQGNGILKDQRLYQLIRQTGPVTDREFLIEFVDPGAEAFSVTFG